MPTAHRINPCPTRDFLVSRRLFAASQLLWACRADGLADFAASEAFADGVFKSALSQWTLQSAGASLARARERVQQETHDA